MQDSSMQFDVVIVGAGPAGLSTAMALARQAKASSKELSICVLEKGSEVGAHIVSGCVLEPRALNAVWPGWEKTEHPLTTQVTHDAFYMLTQTRSWRLPTPPQMWNKGNYIVSLAAVCRWLAAEVERLGVMVIPGFAVSSAIISEKGKVVGVKTSDMGRLEDGSKGPNFQEGVRVYASTTVLAEGARGSLTEELIARYQLRAECQMQSYAIGVKEVWQVDPKVHRPGHVVHTIGWPLESNVYGGSFLYHYGQQKLALGFVIGLDYANPTLDAHAELQRFKHHPFLKPLFQNAKRVGYAARALNEGGWQAIPKCHFPGGLIVGCAAGFLNVPKIKGTHTAMQSGIEAASAIMQTLEQAGAKGDVGKEYDKRLHVSWVFSELRRCRNIRPGFYKGLAAGLINAAWETVTFGRSPWTLLLREDHKQLASIDTQKKIQYPKPDGIVSFRKLDSVRLTGTNHAEHQPCHLKLKDVGTPMKLNYPIYGGPEAYYCPSQVYEYVVVEGARRLQINSQNCIHCKTCDIKDPSQNIEWRVPQGGDGPRYSET